MIKIVPYPSDEAERRIAHIMGRQMGEQLSEVRAVTAIINDVRKEGDSALIRYTKTYDSPHLSIDMIRVNSMEMEMGMKKTDALTIESLGRASDKIRLFHRNQRPRSFMDTGRAGTLLGQMVNPVATAGIYVPGGKGGQTPLVSTVLMCAIPAKIAGVEKVVMVTPPRSDGSVAPELLAAATIAGVDEIYKLGSAWAVAALAFGTESVPKADVIVGPGNIYVTLAKKLLSGVVGIDMIAGPSEILIIADHTGNPMFIAADLLSQAEHDPMASSVLITTDHILARSVVNAIEDELEHLDRRSIIETSLQSYGAIFTVKDLESAISLSNRLAPEHMELHVENPFDHIGKIRNAGALFLGSYSPEPVGDYMAGPNHVLPTAGTARFSSALSVDHFMKRTSIIHYSREAFLEDEIHIRRLARIEGLTAHERSISVRLEVFPETVKPER